MKKVLVTGAQGTLGTATCQAIAAHGGFELRATDRHRSVNLPVKTEVANLLDITSCYQLVDGIDAVVHLGNHPGPAKGNAQTVFAENCAMNVNIFQAAVESGVKQIIYASSIQAIHGTRTYKPAGPQDPSILPYLPIDGQTPPYPGNTYGASKQAGEILLEMYARTHSLSGAAIRFPWLWWPELFRSQSFRLWRLSPYTPLDEALTNLSLADAGRLIIAILLRPRPGMTICQPTGPSFPVDTPVQEAIQRLYANVPLRRPAERMKTLVDLDVLHEQYQWRPLDDFLAMKNDAAAQTTRT